MLVTLIQGTSAIPADHAQENLVNKEDDVIPIGLAVLLRNGSVTEEQLVEEDVDEVLEARMNDGDQVTTMTHPAKDLESQDSENLENQSNTSSEASSTCKSVDKANNSSLHSQAISSGNQQISKKASVQSILPLYKCSITRRLQQVLGERDILKDFDHHRDLLKYNNQDTELIANYESCLAKVQTAVLHEKTKLSLELEKWEKSFCPKNLKEPSSEDILRSKMKTVFEKINICKTYLKHWKIKV